VVVYLSEIQVFEWQMPQASDGFVRRELAPAHVLEKFADRVRIQGSSQQSTFNNQLNQCIRLHSQSWVRQPAGLDG
jgi:hypothetical protein